MRKKITSLPEEKRKILEPTICEMCGSERVVRVVGHTVSGTDMTNAKWVDYSHEDAAKAGMGDVIWACTKCSFCSNPK